jgi:nucleolar protein 16
VQRHTSSQEHVWLADLVRAHGDDYTAMARDRKLNIWQKTPGEIRRMVKKAGGVAALRGMDVDA